MYVVQPNSYSAYTSELTTNNVIFIIAEIGLTRAVCQEAGYDNCDFVAYIIPAWNLRFYLGEVKCTTIYLNSKRTPMPLMTTFPSTLSLHSLLTTP